MLHSASPTTFVPSGRLAETTICPNCSATVYYEPLGLPDYVSVPVGALAEPGFPAPTVSVYESRKHGWVVVPPTAQHF